MSAIAQVKSNARMANKLGGVLVVIGWVGFGFVAVIEIWYLIDLISKDVSIWSEVQTLATLELVWIGFLALAGFGYAMRLFAAYTRVQTER